MSVNKVILIGNIGKDPEVRYMPNGEAVANLTLATSETWKDKSGDKKEKTEWHNVVFFKRLAEIAGEYLKKGSKIYVEGKITTEKWQDKEGNDRYTTKIIANEMKMLDGKPGVDQTAKQEAIKPNQPAKAGAFDSFEDNIPFAHLGKCGAGVSWRDM